MTTSGLYVHDNGETLCIAHAGSYLSSEYRHAPESDLYWTPLGSWERIDDDYLAEYREMTGHVPTCESCSR